MKGVWIVSTEGKIRNNGMIREFVVTRYPKIAYKERFLVWWAHELNVKTGGDINLVEAMLTERDIDHCLLYGRWKCK